MTRGNVLAALVLSAVVGCSDPKAGTLPSGSPTPSATTTPTPTQSPDLRRELREALETYFDALYAAGLDPAKKTDALAALIAPSCTCYRTVEVLREQGRKGRYVDYTYSLQDVDVIDVGSLGGNIRYTVRQTAGSLRDMSGRVIESYPASNDRYSAHFVRDESGWLLDRIEVFS